MKLYLVRHGQTKENKLGIVMGQRPGGLSDLGKKQIKKLARRLKDEKIDYIFTSDLKRAVGTAKEIAKFHPRVKLVKAKGLRERHHGIYQGKQVKFWIEAKEKSGKEWHEFKPRGGESSVEVQRRVIKFYKKVVAKYPRGSVLFVAHGNALTELLLFLLGKSQDRYLDYHPDNAALSILEVGRSRKPKVFLLNSTRHLTRIMVKRSSKRQIVKSIIKPPRQKGVVLPLVLVIMGLPGSGKTTVANRIMGEFPFFYYVSGESATYALTGKDKCSSGEYKEVYKLIYDLLKEYAQQGKPIIFDATNPKFAFREKLRRVLKGIARVFVLHTVCNENTALARLESRKPDHSNKYQITSDCSPETFKEFQRNLEPLKESELGVRVNTSKETSFRALTKSINQLING